jgi:RNA-directed DNA polymerase
MDIGRAGVHIMRYKDAMTTVISPLLANIYLHHCFDQWMMENNPWYPFERYADDIVIHCNSKQQAEQVLNDLKDRMLEFNLELHPEKTGLVYCKSYFRQEEHERNSFIFLSYCFQPKTIRDMYGKKKCFVIFGATVSQPAKKSIRSKLKETLQVKWNLIPLEWFAQKLNPKIRGWINYYSIFNRQEVLKVFYYLNRLIYNWIKKTYRIIGVNKVLGKYRTILNANPGLFYHWTLGIKQIR